MLDNDLSEAQFYLILGFFIFGLLICKIYRRPILGKTRKTKKLQENGKNFCMISALL